MTKVSMFTIAAAVTLSLAAASISKAESHSDAAESAVIAAPSTAEGFSDFENLVCTDCADGGMMTQIVREALNTVVVPSSLTLQIVDNPEHTRATVSGETPPTLSYPWYKPQCHRDTLLNDHTRSLCKDFVWSESLYEMIVTFYTGPSFNQGAAGNWGFLGSTVCQAGEEFSNFLREQGLTNLNARILRAETPRECLNMLVAGEADVAVLPNALAEHYIGSDPKFGVVQAHNRRDIVMTLHAIAPKDDEHARAYVDALDQGVRNIRNSGHWFKIVGDLLYRTSAETREARVATE